MLGYLWIDAALLLGVLYLAAPVVAKTFLRFSAHCKALQVSAGELPQNISKLFATGIPQFETLGFELIGCYDCGVLANDTRTYVAYFCDRRANDFASINSMVTAKGTASYFEFSSRFSNGLVFETNNNRFLPLTPSSPDARVFRFPAINNVQALFETHRQLLQKYAAGQWAQGEPRGQEIQRLVRVVENYGPRHTRIGYMYPAEGGRSYRLTWKGAFLMTWRGLWPISPLRNQLQRHAMQAELHSLKQGGIAALQKA